MTAEKWNENYPEGTPVRYFLYGKKDRTKFTDTRTRSEAWTLGHGAAVVLIEGKSGGYSLDFLEPITEVA